ASAVSSDGVSVCSSSTASASFTEVSADSVSESLGSVSATVSFLSDGENSGDLAALQLQLRGVFQLTRGRLEAEVEELLPRIDEPLLELVVRELAQILSQQRDHHRRAGRTSS